MTQDPASETDDDVSNTSFVASIESRVGMQRRETLKEDDSDDCRNGNDKQSTLSGRDGRNENARVRVETMVPYEAHLIGTPMMDSMDGIKLSKLTDPSQMRVTYLDTNYIDLQLLRIISPGPTTNVAHNYSRAKNKMSPVNYYRMFYYVSTH